MRRTLWLASYPKSGSTWMRMLLANLHGDAPVDINALSGVGGLASARAWFDATMLFPSGLLTHAEVDRLRPDVYAALAAQDWHPDPELAAIEDAPVGDVRFVKTHDAWTLTTDGAPLLGGARAAAGAVLIVRDPRDVACSLAHHLQRTVDQAIDFMGRADAAFCGRDDRQHNQLRQQLPGWSGYHRGWLEQTELPLHVLRYEDLQADPAGTLAAMLDFAGVGASADRMAHAVRHAAFDTLRAQEEHHGFREAPRPAGGDRFFRRGVSGGWRDELTSVQARRLEVDHRAVMERLGYDALAAAA